MTLLVSLVMITAGIIAFILANTIFKKEQRELTDHLKVYFSLIYLHIKSINIAESNEDECFKDVTINGPGIVPTFFDTHHVLILQ